MIADPGGFLWFRPYARRDQTGPVEWKVVTPEGRPVATVVMPSDIEISQIGPDWVLGVRRSSLGVESVVRLRLER